MKTVNQLRNYDKEPIIIEDYNPQIAFLSFIYVIAPIILIFAYFDGHHARYAFSLFFFGALAYRVYKRTKNIRKIVLTNTDICYFHDNQLIEKIPIEKITNIQKSFQDYYSSKQELSDLGQFIVLMFFPLVIIVNTVLVITKFIFQVQKKGLKGYRFFDSIIIKSNETVINIMPITCKKFEEVEKYIDRLNGYRCKNLGIFYKFSYGYENINQN